MIKDPDQLFEKMFSAAKLLKPDFFGDKEKVRYVDPLKFNPLEVDLFTCKHFRYSYQNEIRIIWKPKEPCNELESFFIEIGNMHSYAEFIKL